MSAGLLMQLPVPSEKKPGWPWDEETSLPKPLPHAACWPQISIVTVSYNQVDFLEEALRSVLLQNYPNLEYIVMDGASTDGSLDLIRRYENHFAYWSSIKD